MEDTVREPTRSKRDLGNSLGQKMELRGPNFVVLIARCMKSSFDVPLRLYGMTEQ
jgi:hypothetical protein